MPTNQATLDASYEAIAAQYEGVTPLDVPELEAQWDRLSEACNPLAYDPSNPAAVPTVAQYAHLTNFGFSALTDAEGETLTLEENPVIDGFTAQFAYLVADPDATSIHRCQSANQAVVSEMLRMLDRTAGQASDDLALYALGVIEDALSQRNPAPAVLSEPYRAVLANVLAAYREDGASETVLDRLEALLTRRNPSRLMVDDDGVASPDRGAWS